MRAISGFARPALWPGDRRSLCRAQSGQLLWLRAGAANSANGAEPTGRCARGQKALLPHAKGGGALPALCLTRDAGKRNDRLAAIVAFKYMATDE